MAPAAVRARLGCCGGAEAPCLAKPGMEQPALIRLAQEMAATGLRAVTDALPNEARFAAKPATLPNCGRLLASNL